MASPRDLKTRSSLKGFVTPEKAEYHAGILSNRVRKRYAHLARRFRRQGIDCFRLYDWDIAEVRAVVDWVAGHVVVGEYVRRQTGPEWLPRMARAVAETLDIPPARVHVRRRQTKAVQGSRYRRMDYAVRRMKVRERDLFFWVDLDDFLDTGLFSDHRDTRVLLRRMAPGQDFLNLFGYTGTFTCAAAAGGARATVTVDRSKTNLDWARDNLELNGLPGPQHALVPSDAGLFLEKTWKQGRRFTLAFVDPPSFFKDQHRGFSFDINRDHPRLLRQVLRVMTPGSFVFFSTNHQRFTPRLDGLPVSALTELTPGTIPEDYRNRRIHRCWRMTVS